MNRRQFLELAAANTPIIAGCTSQPGRQTSSGAPTDTHTTTVGRTRTRPTSTAPTTEAPTPTSGDPNTIYVGPDGSPGDGSRENPVKNIREAMEIVQPGQTISLLPGKYFESPQTKRPGTPDEPITITGPPDAVIAGEKGAEYGDGFVIRHSHIHITGVTFDGLQVPSEPDTADSYMARGIVAMGKKRQLTDLVIKPHAAGNVRQALIVIEHSSDVEVGEFRVIGPAGLDYLLEAEIGHFGEIVYVGPGENPVTDVHIHHIDNSEGHHHIGGFPDIKMNASDVLFEYNTTYGARLPSDNDHGSTAHHGGHDSVFRWNRIGSPVTAGIDVGNYREEPPEDFPKAGTQNSIYGNDFEELGGGPAIRYTPETSEAKQRHICGNTVVGETEGNPTRDCPDDLPKSDTIGHLGGDSPWT